MDTEGEIEGQTERVEKQKGEPREETEEKSQIRRETEETAGKVDEKEMLGCLMRGEIGK